MTKFRTGSGILTNESDAENKGRLGKDTTLKLKKTSN